ncbi:hypothetical protein OG315_02115 [Streptomyces atratus]|nr:hypothetical protein [Streptomyces atratus]
MNRLFTAWTKNVYHRRVHSETGAATAPLARSMNSHPLTVPNPADLAEAFRRSEHRTVSNTALVSLHGNRCQVDPLLVGRRAEPVFGPFALSFLRVRANGQDAGTALPFQVSRHSHTAPRLGIDVEVVRPGPAATRFKVIPRLWVVERTNRLAQLSTGQNTL